ncbi:RecX family transcriptional regulator [Flavobacterium sp. CYK-4]|uniref:regulatory protein RecX n=1 Tax=Flavobacterium lotistagni TaxID=2709660 RepID=UPI00140D8CE7|nr:regulatory protein RecX [Flavobacterium lotistagni]NHM06599.1 RecX family transcriptional regulator [Flavobacterium lotistagni]
MAKAHTNQEVIQKMERYCSYQDRCHQEVIQKMRAMAVDQAQSDVIIVHLIEYGFLNEERFACSFARGKHRIKNWGKTRIISELRARNISQINIATALKELTPEEYDQNFHDLSERVWNKIRESNMQKKKKKFYDYLFRKGYENQLIYDKITELEKK